MPTKSAGSIKTGDFILWHGIRMEVTHSRKARRYPGYQTVQMRMAGDSDQRVISHDVHVSDQIELENKS